MHCTYIKYFNSVCTAASYTRRYTQNIIRRRFKDFTLRTNLHTELYYYKSHASFKISNPRVFAVVILRVFNNTYGAYTRRIDVPENRWKKSRTLCIML